MDLGTVYKTEVIDDKSQSMNCSDRFLNLQSIYLHIDLFPPWLATGGDVFPDIQYLTRHF